ncbi:hypothetical protein [Pseudomonas syringae]|uniref:Uncharacterized protein n=1 Tax=Pseudomonas syringae pv. solidagae TaxID=264458 RepID=A0A3M5KRN8_PSESX|nr:hypothetical protein [Pseudomonas syringae]RMT31428.1 hypothetical protein ALP49_02112 [Pseudomonas syringae pv. solidagae]RMT38229.1 hypothetical protein ALP48_01004 [Pseudomonas syringae pv. solidagae]
MTDATTMTETPAEPASAEVAVPVPPQPWEDVLPESFQMLRLSPLPTDRATGGRPLRFVQFGRAERHSKALSLLRIAVQLPGQRVRKEQNHLDIWADHEKRMVRFGPDSGLQIEPWNRGIGRFMIAHAVHWAQKRWSSYKIEGVALASKDGLNEDTRLRRDHFLRTLGFEVTYADAQHMKGAIKDVHVGNLHSTWNNDKVQIIEILEASQMLEKAEKNLIEQEVTIRQHEDRVSKYKREDSGLRFTIACLVTFAVFQAGLLIWIATHR